MCARSMCHRDAVSYAVCRAVKCSLMCHLNIAGRTPATCPSALQDDEYLYLIMEYLPGGDVMVRAATIICRYTCAVAGEQE